MEDFKKNDSQVEDQIPKRNNKSPNFLSRLIREALSIFFWGYVIIKLFVFDIDYIVN
jgi:hypothetical protein